MLPVLDELGGPRTRAEGARCWPPAAPDKAEGGLRGLSDTETKKSPAVRRLGINCFGGGSLESETGWIDDISVSVSYLAVRTIKLDISTA